MNLASQRNHTLFFATQGNLQLSQVAHYLSQLALHGEWTLGTLFASGYGNVVEAFARLREEEGLWIFQRQIPRQRGIWNDVAIAQLG